MCKNITTSGNVYLIFSCVVNTWRCCVLIHLKNSHGNTQIDPKPHSRPTETHTQTQTYTFFYQSQIIFVEARCSYSKMAKISNFAHTLPLFYAFKMLFRMSTFISINSIICYFASSWVTSPDGLKSEPNCSYKVCSYKRYKQARSGPARRREHTSNIE